MFKNYRNLWLALGAFIILSPLGLIATGTAFGEWGVDQLGGRSWLYTGRAGQNGRFMDACTSA